MVCSPARPFIHGVVKNGLTGMLEHNLEHVQNKNKFDNTIEEEEEEREGKGRRRITKRSRMNW